MAQDTSHTPHVDYARLLDTMADGMYVVDKNRAIRYWNAGATRISGHERELALGRWCGDGLLNHTDEEGNAMCGSRCPLLATMEDGETRSARVLLHHAKGHVVPVRVTASALRDDDGEIVGAVETFTDASRTAEAERRLKHVEQLAMTDPLTGLGNRRFLDQRLAQHIAEGSDPEVSPFSLVMVDIDYFKRINDSAGHAVGDEALVTIATTLRHAVRENDDVCRIGGDEFIILTGPMTDAETEALAARVRTAIGQTRLQTSERSFRVTASLGATQGRSDDTVDSAAARADHALMTAKQSGRDAVVVAPPD